MTDELPDPHPGLLSRSRAAGIFGAVAVVGAVVDQLTKQWAVASLEPQTPVPFVGTVLQLYLIRNSGAAFSLGEGFTWIFTILAACVLGFILVWVLPRLRQRFWAIGLGLVSAGIVGNLIDRLVRPPAFGVGHVIDFLMLPKWPVFNVADMCVTGGAAFLVVLWTKTGRGLDGELDAEHVEREKKKAATQQANAEGEGNAKNA